MCYRRVEWAPPRENRDSWLPKFLAWLKSLRRPGVNRLNVAREAATSKPLQPGARES